MTVNEKECEVAGLSIHAVRGLARRIESCANDARRMGLTVFGGACGKCAGRRWHEPKVTVSRGVALKGTDKIQTARALTLGPLRNPIRESAVTLLPPDRWTLPGHSFAPQIHIPVLRSG